MPAAALIVHSGGPTSVINASLLGVVEEARHHAEISRVLGARCGIPGVLSEDFVDLTAQDQSTLELVSRAPSSALGSSRYEADRSDLERFFAILRKRDLRFFFHNGGNGSMGSAEQIAALARAARYELTVIGIPKTIDNDIEGTDHTPGFASTARFFACAVRDIGEDNRALGGQVEFIEILGRNAGWIAGATALARTNPEDAPHLIFFPEERLRLDQLLDDIDQVYQHLGRCVVAVCEGQLDEHGQPFGADVRRGSRGRLAMNLAHRLAMLAAQHLRLKTRSEKPGLLGRCNTFTVVENDWQEARECGRAAVRAAIAGQGGNMITLERAPGSQYRVTTGLVPLTKVANVERLVPAEWRGTHDLHPAFRDYLLPLIGNIPAYPRLDQTR